MKWKGRAQQRRWAALVSGAGAIFCLSHRASALEVSGVEGDFRSYQDLVILPQESVSPLTVLLKQGAKPVSGNLNVRVVTTGRFPGVDVSRHLFVSPAAPEIPVHFAVWVPQMDAAGELLQHQKLRIEVTDAEGRRICEAEPDLQIKQEAPGFRMLIVSSEYKQWPSWISWGGKELTKTVLNKSRYSFGGTQLQTSGIRVDPVLPSALPEQLSGYRSLDSIVIYEADLLTKISPQQRLALEQYLRQGGLILVPDHAGMQGIARLIESPLNRIESLKTEPRKLTAGITLRRYGLGGILEAASEAVLKAGLSQSVRNACTILHQEQFSPTAALQNQNTNNFVSSLEDALAGAAAGKIPPFGVVAGFLLFYVGLLVPVNYLLLKRMDRRELAWVTVPLLAIQFSGGAYLMGRTLKTAPLTAHRFAIIETYVNTKNEFSGYGEFSLYSDRRGKRNLQTEGTSLTPIWSSYQNAMTPPLYAVDETEGEHIFGFPMKQWEAQRFAVTFTPPTSAQEGITGRLTESSSQYTLTLTNHTHFRLRAGSVIYGRAILPVPELKPEESHTLKFNAYTEEKIAQQKPNHLENEDSGLLGLPLPLSKSPSELSRLTDRERIQSALIETLNGVLAQAPYAYVQGSDGSTRPYSGVNGDAPTLFAYCAWTDASPFSVEVDGGPARGETAALLYVHLSDSMPLTALRAKNPSPEEKN